jgi:sarcosine oxidase
LDTIIAFVGTSWDVAVIGAGVFGAWTAYQIAESGKKVLLVDGYGVANPLSSSGAESRIMRTAYGANEAYTRFAHGALADWMKLFRSTGADTDRFYLKTGVLWLGKKGGELLAASQESMRRAGVDFEVLDTDQIRSRYPQIDPGGEMEAILEPDAGVLLADRCVRAVAKAARRRGVAFLQETVRVPVTDPSTIQTLEGTPIVAETYVFACGAWLPKVFPELLQNMIRPTKQEHFFFGVPPGNTDFNPQRLPAWIDDTDPRMPYGLPDIGGQGIKMGFHREGPPFDPDNDDRLASPDAVAEARRYLAARFPALRNAPLIASKVCQYENSPSGDFLIDRHPEFPHVWFMGGGSGHGFKHGPSVGVYLAGRILGYVPEFKPFTFAAAIAAIEAGQRTIL